MHGYNTLTCAVQYRVALAAAPTVGTAAFSFVA